MNLYHPRIAFTSFFLFLFVTLTPRLTKAQQKLPFLTPGATYLWPTNASHDMTSSFGETRPNHFHAGLDIKTWGRKGYKVFATRDGILYRVRTGPIGYGNVVYLRHKDGSFSVYAHLRDFNHQIRHLVDSLRMINYTFDLDKIVTSYNIHFKKGEVIGYTGSSGIGPPHLHFELRTPDESPFNPFDTNLKVDDHTRPRILALSVEPLDRNSLVNGRKHILIKRAYRTGENYSFGTVHVRGPIGLGVNTYDKADHVHNEFAVYQLYLKLGKTVYFHSKIDSFSYSNTDQLNLDRVYPLIRRNGEGFQRLYRKDGNTLPFYIQMKNRGIINLPKGTYTFEIIASDYFGNTSKATVRLVVNDPQKKLYAADNKVLPKKPSIENASFANRDINGWYWSEDWVSPSEPLHDLQVVELKPGDPVLEEYPQISRNEGINLNTPYPLLFKFRDHHELLLHRVFPGKESVISTPDQKLEVTFRPHTVYDTLSVFIDHRSRKGLPVVQTGPEDEPIHSHLMLSYHLNSEQASLKGLAYYSYNAHHGRFDYQPSTMNQNLLIGEVKAFGTYYVLQDTIPPVVSHPRIYRRGDGKWVASVKVSDNLSDIAFRKAKFYCNSIRGIPEYDPESQHLTYYRPSFVPEKIDTLKIVVFDQAGNHTEATFTVRR